MRTSQRLGSVLCPRRMGSRWESFPRVQTPVGNEEDSPSRLAPLEGTSQGSLGCWSQKRRCWFATPLAWNRQLLHAPVADLFCVAQTSKKYISCYRVLFGRVCLKCPASLENVASLATLGPHSQGRLLARAEVQPPPLSRARAFWLAGFPLGGDFSASPFPVPPGPWRHSSLRALFQLLEVILYEVVTTY